MISELFAGRRGRILVLLIAAAAVAGFLLLRGGGDDNGGSAGTGTTGGTFAEFKDGACVKQSQTPGYNIPGQAIPATPGTPEVVDCGDPAVTGVLHETSDSKNCPQGQTGIKIFAVHGKKPEGTGSFCIEEK